MGSLRGNLCMVESQPPKTAETAQALEEFVVSVERGRPQPLQFAVAALGHREAE
jgi:hypothetical protein